MKAKVLYSTAFSVRSSFLHCVLLLSTATSLAYGRIIFICSRPDHSLLVAFTSQQQNSRKRWKRTEYNIRPCRESGGRDNKIYSKGWMSRSSSKEKTGEMFSRTSRQVAFLQSNHAYNRVLSFMRNGGSSYRTLLMRVESRINGGFSRL